VDYIDMLSWHMKACDLVYNDGIMTKSLRLRSLVKHLKVIPRYKALTITAVAITVVAITDNKIKLVAFQTSQVTLLT